MDIALLIVRLVVGLAIAAHGTQKLFGWFGGYGVAGTAGFFEGLGFRPGRLFVYGASLGEIGGGVLTALGLGGPIGPALVVMVMVVAIFSVHISKGFWAQNGGYELNTLYIAIALLLGFVGFGTYSLDRALSLSLLAETWQIWTTFAVAVLLAFANLAARKAPAPSAAG